MTRNSRTIATAAVVAVLFAAGCREKKEVPVAAAPQKMMSAMASPQVQQLVFDSSLQHADAREMTEILGYNDIQALPRNAGTADWGPVARLYALRRDRVVGDYTRPAGAMVAVLEVDSAHHMPPAYRHLGIEDNSTTASEVYCVFLLRTNNSQNPWKGAVTKATGSQCDAVKPSQMMDADSVPQPGFETGADFPAYAVRFMQSNSGMPSLGVRCFNAICEIGNATNTSNGNTSSSNGRTGRIKTWNDDQQLAERPNPSGGLRRGPLVSITPVEGLASLSTEFGQASGAHAASILVHGTAPKGAGYSRWGLADNDTTDVWLKYVVSATNPADTSWFVQFKTNGAATQWDAIVRKGHRPGLVPGTARWAWDPADEGIWMACDQGCCEVTGLTLAAVRRDSAKGPDSTKKPPL